MREQAPVFRRAGAAGGPATWYLTRYADVQQALMHPDLGRRQPSAGPAFDPLAALRRNVFNLDPPDHTRLRRLIAPAFGPRAVAAVAHRVEAAVGELCDAMAGAAAEADVITALALPLPVVVVAELIGLPPSDHALLRRLSDEVTRTASPARIRRAGQEFTVFLRARIAERRSDIGPDLLSDLVRAHDAGALDHTELVSTVFQLLLAGDETTVNLIGNGVLELLRHPDQLARLRADPELIGPAIEEMLRFNGPAGHTRPVTALADLEISGTVIPRGDTVVPVLLSANRDPAVFDAPDTFDIGRTPNRHLAFGHGIHFCPGAALARIQARAAIGTLVHRFPALAPAVDPAELEWTPDLFIHGVRRLPVLLKGR